MLVYVWGDTATAHIAPLQVEAWPDDLSVNDPAICGVDPGEGSWTFRWYELEQWQRLCKRCKRALRNHPEL